MGKKLGTVLYTYFRKYQRKKNMLHLSRSNSSVRIKKG